MKKIRINRNRSTLKFTKNKLAKNKFKQIDLEEKLANLEQILHRTQMLIEQDEHDEKRDQLLKMMYSNDVDANFVKTTMKISDDELNSFINELEQMGFLEFVSDDEIKLTKDGIIYVKNQNSTFFS